MSSQRPYPPTNALPNPYGQPNPYAQPQPVVYQQPMATKEMFVAAGGNKNAKNKPVGPDGREWSNGICGCGGDVGTCAVACCFPCIVYGQNKQRLEHLQRHGIPDPEHGATCTGDCWVHGLITGCFGLGWILQISPRGSIRSRYNIKGGGCGDCCTIFWCTPCALTQERQEIELEEQSFNAPVGRA